MEHAPRGSASPSGHRNALVADDDDDSRRLLAGTLRRAGFDVIEASDGDELLQRYRALRARKDAGPTVVVSDIGMPGCDGIAATQVLRNDSPVPIVLVTAFDDAETLRTARSAGADLVLFKPVDGALLVRAVLGLTTEEEQSSRSAERSPVIRRISTSGGDRSRFHVLAIEDDVIDVETLLRAFEEAEAKHPLTLVRDPRAALELLRGNVLDPRRTVVLLDMHLPGMSGIELLRQLRADAGLAGLRVFVLTSSDDDRARAEARALDVSGYLIKPSSFPRFVELVVALENYLGTAELA